jgi:hypothetical protein
MEKKKVDRVKKIVIIIGICALILYIAFIFYKLNHEADPYCSFYEVPVTETINSSVIHLTDVDILNKQGWEVRQENGKITRIYFRDSQNRDSSFTIFIKNMGVLQVPSQKENILNIMVFFIML